MYNEYVKTTHTRFRKSTFSLERYLPFTLTLTCVYLLLLQVYNLVNAISQYLRFSALRCDFENTHVHYRVKRSQELVRLCRMNFNEATHKLAHILF
jgi:hypothetical protein